MISPTFAVGAEAIFQTERARPNTCCLWKIVDARHRLPTGTVVLPLLALALTFAVPLPARAAVNTIPVQVRELDAAAMSLFDAAEAGNWADAGRALDRVKRASSNLTTLEAPYVEAGGQLEDFFQVTNNFGADLIEAATALTVKDRRTLVSSADRLAARAGELSMPFAKRASALAPHIEALLFFARRMRSALAWHDISGFRMANDHFQRLRQALNNEFAKQAPEKVRAIDEALKRVSVSGSSADVKLLYTAIQDLRGTLQ
jgi:hypothetical protein